MQVNGWVRSLTHDVGKLAVAAGGLVIAEVLIRLFSGPDSQLPIAVLLLPVLGLALVAEGPATAVIGAAAVALATVEYAARDAITSDLRLRFAALVAGAGLAVALAASRTRREQTLRRRYAELARAAARADTENVLKAMMERLPELTQGTDPQVAAADACVLAKDLFGADRASYWHVNGDDAVLWARVPQSDGFELGARQPRALLAGDTAASALTRTAWVRRSEVNDQQRAQVMHRAGAAVGTATPVGPPNEALGYLAMSWSEDREAPDPSWLDALDRFGDQVALAKTVIRRRAAEQKAREQAQRFQLGMLPDLPSDGPVEVRSFYRPGGSQMLLGGDFLDAQVDPSGLLCFVLGDVAGHGPEQAALGATLRGAWRGLAAIPQLGMDQWAIALNSVVQQTAPVDGLFVTVIVGRLDPQTKTLAYVSAGHPPPVILGRVPVTAPRGDVPLGVVDEPEFVVHTLELEDGDAVLLVTDGLFEGHRVAGEPGRFDHESFVDLVHQRGIDLLDDPDYLADLADEMERCNGEPLADDAAALLLRLIH